MFSPQLEARIRSPEFWVEFLFVDETAAAPWEPWAVAIPLGTHLPALRLSVDRYAHISLAMDLEEGLVEVAWDDLAHWHPHVLRWPELDAICRHVQGQATRDPHPGALLLLLARFTPITGPEDAAMALPMMAAWRQLGINSPEAHSRLLQISDFREAGVHWREVPTLGWCLEQQVAADGPRAYSLRVEDNQEFPWCEWARLSKALLGPGPAGLAE